MATFRRGRTELRGSTEEILGLLTTSHKHALKGVPAVTIEDNGDSLLFNKTRRKLCPKCGRVFGREVQLVAAWRQDFNNMFTRDVCPECARGYAPQQRAWLKEFLADDEITTNA